MARAILVICPNPGDGAGAARENDGAPCTSSCAHDREPERFVVRADSNGRPDKLYTPSRGSVAAMSIVCGVHCSREANI